VSDGAGEWRCDEAVHWAEGKADEPCTLIWGSGETMAHRGGAPHRGDSAEGSSWWQTRGDVGNATEVAGERHGAIEELGDMKAALDDRWIRLSVVVCSTAHDT
jgi:hypothetical protein